MSNNWSNFIPSSANVRNLGSTARYFSSIYGVNPVDPYKMDPWLNGWSGCVVTVGSGKERRCLRCKGKVSKKRGKHYNGKTVWRHKQNSPEYDNCLEEQKRQDALRFMTEGPY